MQIIIDCRRERRRRRRHLEMENKNCDSTSFP